MPDTTPPADPAAILNAQVDATIEHWPAEARTADPGPADAAARHAWAESMRPAVERLTAPTTTPPPAAPAAKYPFQRADDVDW